MTVSRIFTAGLARLCALLLMMSVVAPAAPALEAAEVTPAEEAAIEAAIKELATQWSTAYLKHDPSILERIWAPDFVYVEPSGHRFT